MKVSQLALALALLGSLSAQAQGTSFSHKDWEVACDNTLTCRAAGYSEEGTDGSAVSVLLTRPGGPQGMLKLELALSDFEEPAIQPSEPVELLIDGKSLGTVKQRTAFNPVQTEALLRAVKGTGKVEFRVGDRQALLSSAGAYASLLKMDEFQGRLGTVTALTKRGDKPASSVPAALEPPVIKAAAVAPDSEKRALTAAEIQSVNQWLSKHTDDCDWPDEETPEATLYSFTKERSLVERLCNRGAYNESFAYLLVSPDMKLSNAQLITIEANAYSQGQLSAAYKGRGVGDCFSFQEWTWDGKAFVLSNKRDTGMCRGIAAGGTWDLPTLVTRVVKAK